MAFDKSNPLTIGLIALFVVATVAALFGGGVSGNAAYSTIEVELPFYVQAEYISGWGTCTGQEQDWTVIDNLCKSMDYAGAAPAEERPCLHEWKSERWTWDGSIPMIRGELNPTVGWALTKVMCI